MDCHDRHSVKTMKRKDAPRRNRRYQNGRVKSTMAQVVALAVATSTVALCCLSSVVMGFPISTLHTRGAITETYASTTSSSSSFDDTLWKKKSVSTSTYARIPLMRDSTHASIRTKTEIRSSLSPNLSLSSGWENDFAALVAYRQQYGHFSISKHSDPRLYSFCKNVRQNYKYQQLQQSSSSSSGTITSSSPSKGVVPIHQHSLTDDRIRSLEEIGFVWTPRDDMWNVRYEQLKAFYEEHGHCQLPSTTNENKELRQWVSYQRCRYRSNAVTTSRLNEEQIRLLQDIQFSWTPQEERWWGQFRQLETFVKTHGHYSIHGREYTKLRCYKNTLRRHCREYVLSVMMEGTTDGVHVSGLTDERLDALRRIRFCWLPPPGPLSEIPPADIFEGYQSSRVIEV